MVACLLAACGSPAPSSSAAANGSLPALASPEASGGIPLIPYDQATAVDAAQAEVDDIQHLREVAGIATLIGPAGPTVLKNVDAAKVENARTTLPEVAKLLGLDLSATDPQIASVQDLQGTSRPRDGIDWTGSLVGQVSATTSMMMALLPTAMGELAGRSEGTRPGAPIDKTEVYTEPPHDGVTEKISIRTRVRITAGGGKVAMDLDINSVDTISDEATGAEIERLEGNSHGHIDVNACPDRNGVSAGTYQLSLQEELVRPGSSGAGDTKVIQAPFSLVNGDDAHLVRIEGSLNITQHAHGPAPTGGDAFNWSVGAGVSEVIPANGASTATTPSVQTDGDPTQAQVDNTTGGRQTAENYLKVLATETEKFWRSGKCIELKPSDDTRKVQPKEKIDLTVKAMDERRPGDPETDRGQVHGDKVARPEGSARRRTGQVLVRGRRQQGRQGHDRPEADIEPGHRHTSDRVHGGCDHVPGQDRRDGPSGHRRQRLRHPDPPEEARTRSPPRTGPPARRRR